MTATVNRRWYMSRISRDVLSFLAVESLILMLEHDLKLPDKLMDLINKDYNLLNSNPILVRFIDKK